MEFLEKSRISRPRTAFPMWFYMTVFMYVYSKLWYISKLKT
jgi:hypothetical protein